MIGDRITQRLVGADTGGAFALCDMFVVPGGGPPAHVHERESETFHVTEGQVTVHVAGQTLQAGPGTTVHVPAGVVHHFRNDGVVPLRMSMVIAPAGFEAFFAEAGIPTTIDDEVAPPADPARIARIIALAPNFHLRFVP